MNGGEFVVSYAVEPALVRVGRWRRTLVQRLISMVVSVAIGAAVWYFFRDTVGDLGLWLIGSAVVVGLGWVVVAGTALVLARRDARRVGQGPAVAVTRDGLWIAQNWLPWPQVGALHARPRRLGQSPDLVVEGRDGGSVTVPMDYLDALPASIDSAVRALSGGRVWIDLSRLDD